eukprot:scaffold1481_cov401-Prasinococcus_capsulatus_cf.AAC.2
MGQCFGKRLKGSNSSPGEGSGKMNQSFGCSGDRAGDSPVLSPMELKLSTFYLSKKEFKKHYPFGHTDPKQRHLSPSRAPAQDAPEAADEELPESRQTSPAVSVCGDQFFDAQVDFDGPWRSPMSRRRSNKLRRVHLLARLVCPAGFCGSVKGESESDGAEGVKGSESHSSRAEDGEAPSRTGSGKGGSLLEPLYVCMVCSCARFRNGLAGRSPGAVPCGRRPAADRYAHVDRQRSRPCTPGPIRSRGRRASPAPPGTKGLGTCRRFPSLPRATSR